MDGHFDLYGQHFGKHDHNYSHWLPIQLGCGRFSLPHLMMRYDEAALAQRRDAAPLRLIFWLTFGLPKWLQDIVEALMMHYGNQCPGSADNLNAFLQEHFPNCPTLESPDAIRDHIVARISAWNEEWQPKSLLDLFEGFLRMPLHRLAHFLDMILPQLSPMHTRWDDPRKTLLCCHFFRLESAGTSAKVRLQFLFTSRALIYMVRIGWERQPLLLFSDVHRIGLESFQHFQTPTNGSVNKHNVQMGLPEGHSVLLHFSQNGFAYQAVLVSNEFRSLSRGKRGEHANVEACSTTVNGLCLAAGRCSTGVLLSCLRQDQTRQYGSFNELQLGFNEHYQAWLHIQGLYYLGETRSVEEFGITYPGTILPGRDPERGRVWNLQPNAGREALSWMWSTIGRTKPLAYCRHRTEENSSKLHCD